MRINEGLMRKDLKKYLKGGENGKKVNF